MRKICVVIALVILLSQMASMTAAATEDQETYDEFEQSLDNDLPNRISTLCDNSQYSYHLFYDMTKDKELFHAAMEGVDFLTDVECKPDKDKYMEVLMTMLVIYDQDNAEKFSEQYKRDNLKTGAEYVGDVVDVLASGFSVIIADLPGIAKFKDAIGISLDFMSAEIEEENIMADVLSDYYALIKDYSKFDTILAEIENNSEGELKEAAQTMRKYTSKQMECVIDAFSEGDKDSLNNLSEFFFSDFFTDMLRGTEEYANDSSLESYLSVWDSAVHYKDIFDCITGSAVLVADGIVGYEDLINRYVEITALVEIDEVLEKQIGEHRKAYEEATDRDIRKENAAILLDLSEALVGNRIRGEYCNYNIFCKDAKLESWFVNKFANTSSVDNYYKTKIELILDISEEVHMLKEKLNRATDSSINDNISTNTSSESSEMETEITHPEAAVSSENWYYVHEGFHNTVRYSKDRSVYEDLEIPQTGNMQLYNGKLYISGYFEREKDVISNFLVYDEASNTSHEMTVNTSDGPLESMHPILCLGEWQIYKNCLYYIYLDAYGRYWLKCADLDGRDTNAAAVPLNNNANYVSYTPCFFIMGGYVYYTEFVPTPGYESIGSSIETDYSRRSYRIWKVSMEGGRQELFYEGKEGYNLELWDITPDYMLLKQFFTTGRAQQDLIILPLKVKERSEEAVTVLSVPDAYNVWAHFYGDTLLYSSMNDGLYQYDLKTGSARKLTDQIDREFTVLDDCCYEERYNEDERYNASNHFEPVWYSLLDGET